MMRHLGILLLPLAFAAGIIAYVYALRQNEYTCVYNNNARFEEYKHDYTDSWS